jgi:hypothetical protein
VGFSGDDLMGANGNGEEERCVAGEGEMPKSKPASEAELWLPLPLGFLFSGCSAGLTSSFACSVLVSSRDAASRAAFKLDVDSLDCVTSPPACDVEYSDDVYDATRLGELGEVAMVPAPSTISDSVAYRAGVFTPHSALRRAARANCNGSPLVCLSTD